MPDTRDEMAALPLVLGWSNPESAGGESLRLYALDAGGNPRWDHSLGRGGRTVERALIHASAPGQHGEGDRYLLIRLGDRFSDVDASGALANLRADAASAGYHRGYADCKEGSQHRDPWRAQPDSAPVVSDRPATSS